MTQIKDASNRIQHEHAKVVEVFVQYSQQLLGEKDPDRKQDQQCIFRQGPTLSDDQQIGLMQLFSRQEIKKPMLSINANKSLRPNGYGGGFFKDAWDIIEDDVHDAMQEFFHNGKLLRQLNITIISLIPRLEKPEVASQFRLISYCNTLYKYISKLLCSRLIRV